MHTKVSSVSSVGLNDWPIDPVDRSLEPQLRARIDGKAKPLGALGRLEDLAVQLGLIWHPLAPRTERATVFVFAADHGITAEGVSLYPAEVTRAMVATYLAGRAGVNALARASNVDVQVIDAGVDADIPAHPATDRRQDPARQSQRRARAGADAAGGARWPGARRVDRRGRHRGRYRRGGDRRNGHRQHDVGGAVDAPARAGAARRLRRRRHRARRGRDRAQARGRRTRRRAQRRDLAARRVVGVRRL